jgi:hypothetical protein
MKKKVIIHALDGISEDEAVSKVELVMSQGKISANGKSYCYGTRIGDKMVSTDKPRKNSPNTYTLYVYRDNQ